MECQLTVKQMGNPKWQHMTNKIYVDSQRLIPEADKPPDCGGQSEPGCLSGFQNLQSELSTKIVKICQVYQYPLSETAGLLMRGTERLKISCRFYMTLTTYLKPPLAIFPQQIYNYIKEPSLY
jgi:hypothetical protein